MKRIIAMILLVTISACALPPAPITNLDVCATMNGLCEPERTNKKLKLLGDISDRKQELEKYNNDVTWGTILMIACTGPLALIYYFGFKPAVNEHKKEIEELNKKKNLLLSPQEQSATANKGI